MEKDFSKELRDCTSDEIADCLVAIYQIVGILPQNYPINAGRLISYIKSNFGGVTSAGIIIAFELSAKGNAYDEKIDFKGCFSISYLEKVLQAFQRYRRLKNPAPALVEHKPGEKERMESMKTGCIQAWQYFQSRDQILDFGGTRYDFLIENKIADTDELEFSRYRIMASETIDSDRDHKNRNPREKGEIIMILAKNIALRAFFQGLIHTETDFMDLIKQI